MGKSWGKVGEELKRSAEGPRPRRTRWPLQAPRRGHSGVPGARRARGPGWEGTRRAEQAPPRPPSCLRREPPRVRGAGHGGRRELRRIPRAADGRSPRAAAPRRWRAVAGRAKGDGRSSAARAPDTLPDAWGRDGATRAWNYAVIQQSGEAAVADTRAARLMQSRCRGAPGTWVRRGARPAARNRRQAVRTGATSEGFSTPGAPARPVPVARGSGQRRRSTGGDSFRGLSFAGPSAPAGTSAPASPPLPHGFQAGAWGRYRGSDVETAREEPSGSTGADPPSPGSLTPVRGYLENKCTPPPPPGL